MVQLQFFPDSTSLSTILKLSNDTKRVTNRKDYILELLLRSKQDFNSIRVADSINIDELISKYIGGQKSINYPKRQILGDDFTDEDYKKLCEMIEFQHEQFQRHTIRDIKTKVEKFKLTFTRLTTEEIYWALDELEFNEDEAAIYLTSISFISKIRRKIALLHQSQPQSRFTEKEAKKPQAQQQQTIIEPANRDEKEKEPDHEELGTEDMEHEESESDNNFSYEDEDPGFNVTVRNKSKRSLSSTSSTRLRLDDAVANVTNNTNNNNTKNPDQGMEKWSEARVQAYKLMEKNPNAYYYRFNAPGETQKNGTWSESEHELFMKRLAEIGPEQWGIFSIAIPGRVGYQCSNYYRKLIASGDISDSNYYIDEKGKVHFITSKTRPKNTTTTATTTTTSKRRYKIEESESSSNSESEDEKSNITSSTSATAITPQTTDNFNFNSRFFYENPLPNFIDAITRAEVVRPAISPYGHVLSYDTWLKCLLNSDRKNICPLTNRPLHKRQLIFLTFENIEMYRDKIISL